MANKNFGTMNFGDILNDLNKMANQVTKGAESVEKIAGDAGEQVGTSFADGVDRGFEDAIGRIAASSLKITKAFKDLAKRITNQKDIFNISIGGQSVALDIDFSDIDINSADFQKKIDEAFEKIKIDNAIEFDSKAVEKQFKNMLGLYVKYSDKLYQLQNQSTKLTNPDSMKHNVQEQIAMINGLKEIQRILDKTSGMSISLPHASSSSEKYLRTIVETIDRVYKGEEKVGKQRDTNAAKLKKENKELKERNKILEEKVGPIEGEQAPPARKPRAKKQKQSVEVGAKTIEETSVIKAKSDEQSVVAEQTQLNILEDELKVEKEITKEKEKQYGYHAGKFRDDGFKAENLWQSTPGRSTGFYGTGTYLTDKTHLNEITTGQYGQRPLNVIDPDMYNLFNATNDKTASQLHQFLKSITNKAFGGKGENIKSLYANFKELFPKEQIITYEDFKALVGELQQYVKNNGSYPANKYMDSVSTKFMKSFGYEGVDTRGTKYADTTYGTVIYDLKEESVVLKEITDEMQKQEIIAGNIASVVEKQTNSRKKSTEPEIYETDSGQMSILPAVEEEIKAKDKLAESNDKVAKSEKKVKEAAQGTQMTMDDFIPASVEDSVPKVEEEEKALDKVGEAAEKAAGKKQKFAKANKEVAASTTPSIKGLLKEADALEEVGEKANTAWSTTRPGVESNRLANTSDTLDNFNLPSVYMGEQGQQAVQVFAKLKSEIEEMTGKPVTIDFSSAVNENGQLEAVGATLKYVNEEAGITVKQFYDIARNEDGIVVATQSHEKAILSATKAAKSFNTEMQRKLATEQIKTLEGQLGEELKLDLTEVKNAANAINDKASLDNFNLALKAAKEQAKQLKTELKGQNTLDTIASMERALLTLPSRLDEVQRRLNTLGDVEGADTIDDVLRSINQEYQRFLSSTDSGEKVKLFRSLTSSMVWVNAELRNLSGQTSEAKRDETAVEKEELAKQKAARESYINWWKTTIAEQAEADAYEQALLERERKEKEKDEKVIAARKKKEEEYNAWWQKALFDKERAPNLKYGKTTANSTQRKLDATEGAVDALGVTNPEIIAKMDVYKAKVNEVLQLRARFESDPNAAEDSTLVRQFQKAAVEAENVRRGIKAVIDEEQKMRQLSEEQGFDPIELTSDQLTNLKDEMMAFAQANANGRVEIKGFNDDNTKMYYTVTDSKGSVQEMTTALGQGTNQLYKYRTATKETGTLVQQIFKGIKVKAKELLSFVIGGGSVYKVIELLRQGIQYVREIDLALTELKKVTDETEEEYDQFLQTAAKTGERLGSTISAVTEATSTFAKLGYEIKQATEMAEAAIVYKNVGDNIASTEDAADSIISTMKGFRLEASESMEIVDRFNEVGNRFAITSQGIGEALRLSASALSEGGNSLDESIGLITAANEVVNDPSSVGTALKTLTLRLRGSKTELEEMGEDVSDMATTTSALQAKLLALTGGQVDIMLDETTFKNSTQIIREMAAAWEDMNDIQRASALELMGGKRQANVLSALIQNFDTVEKVIETSANSSGSALEENERYLDSIQGKIDQFNNAMQAMWSNTLDSDVVKDFVAFGTEIIKIIDKIGLLNSALLSFGAFKGFGVLFKTLKKDGVTLKSVWTWINQLTLATRQQQIADAAAAGTTLSRSNAEKLLNTSIVKRFATEQIDAKVKEANRVREVALVTAKQALALAEEQYAEGLIDDIALQTAKNAVDAASVPITSSQIGVSTILGATFKGLAASIWGAVKAMVAFLFTNPVGWAILAIGAIAGGVAIFNALTVSAEEASEQLEETKNKISDLESELESLQTELDAAREKIAELTALPYLSLTQQEDLDRLEREVELLERQIALKERQLAIEEAKLVEDAEIAVEKNWGPTDKNKKDKKKLNKYIEEYEKQSTELKDKEDAYLKASKEIEENQALSYETWKQVRGAQGFDEQYLTEDVYKYYDWDNLDKQKDLLSSLHNEIETTEADFTNTASKIEEIFNDPTYAGLEYGMSDEIDAFLDDFNNAQLKWEKALYGDNGTANIIESLWGPNASEEMKAVKSEIDKIMAEDGNWASDDEKWQSKNDAIKNYIESLDETADGYHQLDYVINELGKTSQDIADYFTVLNGEFNSNTLDGVLAQYAKGVEILEQFQSTLNDTSVERMKELQEGGNVDLFNRPQIDASRLAQAGWEDAGDGVATVFSSTFANEAGSIAMNFTPILPNGEVLSPDELTEYAESVIAGTRQDDLNIKIGATFEGENAIQQADQTAQEIHELQESYYMGDQTIKIDNIEYDWDEMFKLNDDGEFEADAVKFAEVLDGMDNKTRETFMNIAESVKNGAKGWNEAIASFNISGVIAATKVLEEQWAEVNKSMFKDIDDGAISGWIDTFSELSAALEDVAGTMDLLHTAQTQMNNSGRVSIKTALEIIETTDNWEKVLTITGNTITLTKDAEDQLVQSKLNVIKAQVDEALGAVELQLAQLGAADSAYSVAIASDVSDEAYEQYTNAMNSYSASIAGFGAALDALLDGDKNTKVFDSFSKAYNTAKKIADTSVDKTRIDRASLEQKQRDLTAQKNILQQGGTVSGFKNNYDFDKTPGDKYDDSGDEDDAFQRAMDYWENRIGANQARYEQLQNEIDLLESKGQKADASYYEEQIKLENERLSLLQQQKAEAQSFLGTFEEGSEEWWSVAETLNSIESELDDVTASIVDLQDAIGEIDTYKFEEFNTRLDNLVSKLGTIRDLIAPDESDWFDDQGEWTEEGVAVLGSYVQELELYKQGLEETETELKKYNKAYSNNTKAYYESLGIHSEQEYYEKVEELTEQQYNLAESISDTEQSIVDMYESSIDAVEEYIDTLIDGYNDYIDSVKEALDAERDLYEFKKNVQKQAKDIAELERRIASLSGSTNKSEIAERRKLEAQLYEARESLNDTYYDHAKDSQNDALDAEQSAYEETMNKFIEGLRIGLETATRNMDEFLMSVTSMVTLNADTVLQKYQETELPLSDAIANPWEAAKEAVGNYSGDALELMNTWTQNGFLTTFPEMVTGSLKSPWEAGQTAAGAFTTTVNTEMGKVVTAIETNVKTASSKLSELYKQIEDTAKKAAEVSGGVYTGGDDTGDDDDGYEDEPDQLDATPKRWTTWQQAADAGYSNIAGASASEKARAKNEYGTYQNYLDAMYYKYMGKLPEGVKSVPQPVKKETTTTQTQKAPSFKDSGYGIGISIGKKTYNQNLEIKGSDGKYYYPYTNSVGNTGYIKKGEGYKDAGNGKMDVQSFKPMYKKYATGTTGTTRDEWAITDEKKFGDELVLVPGKDGNLSFMRKGTGVVPADMTQKLFELAQIPTSDLMNKNLTAIVPNITKNDFKNEFNFESLVHVDTVDSDTLPKLEKMVDKKIDDFSKSLNYSLKKFTR